MEYIRTAEREFPAGDDFSLEYEGRSGNIVVEGGDVDKARVQIVAHIYEETADAADATLQRIVDGVHMDGNVLRIVPPQIVTGGFFFFANRGARIDYAVTVPRRTRCRLVSSSGRVEVARIAGPLDVIQKSGRTSVRMVEGDTRVVSKSGSTDVEDIGGNLTVQAQSGKISVDRVKRDAKLSGQSGSVKAEHIGGSLVARAQSGRIEVLDVGGNVNLASQSGRVVLVRAGGEIVCHSVSGSVTFEGQALGNVNIATTSGGIHFNVDPTRPFFLDAETVSGSIRSDMPPRKGEGPPPEGAPTVKLRTVSGSIRIGPRPSVGVGFDFGTGSAFGIKIDPDLDIEFGEDFGDRIAKAIEIRMQRVHEKAAQAGERAQRHAERAERHAERARRRAERHAEREAERARRRATGEPTDDLDFDDTDDDEELI
jgi:hypothetical protein